MLEQLDGRSLRTFLTVMEEKSFSRAADRLGYVQSTVTAHIALLEKASGKKLFDRLPRGVEPTEAGTALARFAERFVELSRALEDVLHRTGQPSGLLRVRALESYCVARLPWLLAEYVNRHQGVELQLTTGFMEDICERVLEQQDDLGIVPKDPQHEGLVFVPLRQEQLIWVSASDGKWREKGKGAYISYGSTCLYHEIGERSLREAGYQPTGHMRFPSIELIKRMVQSGFGISLLPEVNVREEMETGKLQQVDLPAPDPLTHGLIYLRERELRAAAAAFIELASTHLVDAK